MFELVHSCTVCRCRKTN